SFGRLVTASKFFSWLSGTPRNSRLTMPSTPLRLVNSLEPTSSPHRTESLIRALRLLSWLPLSLRLRSALDSERKSTVSRPWPPRLRYCNSGRVPAADASSSCLPQLNTLALSELREG